MSEHRNNVANAVSGTPGTGTITLASAVTGSQSFATAYGANATVDVFITDGTAWEVARNCTYTHSGTTLSRGTLEASSTGSAISLTSAAVVRCAMPASTGDRIDRLIVSGFSAYGDGTTTVTLTNGGTTLVSTAAKTEVFDTYSEFDPSTGIWFPTKSGLYLVGGSAIIGANTTDGATVAVYVEHSTDGSSWSASTKRALLWRGINGAAFTSMGGTGAYLVDVNGTTDRFRMTVFYSGTGTNICPGSASNRDWIRFSARYIGETS